MNFILKQQLQNLMTNALCKVGTTNKALFLLKIVKERLCCSFWGAHKVDQLRTLCHIITVEMV